MSPIGATNALARLTVATLPAGPRVAASTAAATVARLRKAVIWADSRLPGLTGLPEACHEVSASPVEILDRRGALRVCASALHSLANSQGLAVRTSALLESAVAARTLVSQLKGMWDPSRKVRVFVAPNVLTEAHRHDLDQQDWSRWVVLRTSVVAVHHVQAPHLSHHLLKLLKELPDSGEELARFAVLSDALSRATLSRLTTLDLPSLGWIRSHDTDIIEDAHATALRAMLGRVVDLRHAFAQTRDFAEQIVAAGATKLLLAGPENLPTLAEYADSAAWLRRID